MIIVSMQLIYCPAMSESIAAYLKPVYYFLNVYVKERTHMYILPYVFFLFFHILFLYVFLLLYEKMSKTIGFSRSLSLR